MSFLAPLAAPLGLAIGGLFGGMGKSVPQATPAQFTPAGFSGGGLTGTFGGGSYNISPSADRTGAVGNIANVFGQQAGDIAGLRQQFAPGFSQLRQAQLDQIAANKAGAIGNLQQNLQNRRVLGSSFAQDAINRTTETYNQQQQQVIAQTFLQELSAQQQLQQQQYEAARGAFQTGLTEMNLEAGLASQLTQSINSALAGVAESNARLSLGNAQLQAQAQAGAGKFFGGLGQLAGSALGSPTFTSGLSSLFA